MVRSIQHFRRILQKDASSSRKCKEKCLFFPSPIPRQSFAANQLSTFTEQTNRQTRVKTSLVELMDPAGRRKGLTRRRNVNHAWSPLKKEKKEKRNSSLFYSCLHPATSMVGKVSRCSDINRSKADSQTLQRHLLFSPPSLYG